MPVQDLREWIGRIEEMGELTRIEGADPNLEIGGLTDLYQWDMENPALLFEKIKGPPGELPAPLERPHVAAAHLPEPRPPPRNLTRQEFVKTWREPPQGVHCPSRRGRSRTGPCSTTGRSTPTWT